MTNGKATIKYHGENRDSRIIALQSYGNPPPESKFTGLDYFEFRLKDVSALLTASHRSSFSFKYLLPAEPTTYHCKVYRVPTRITERKHAIAVRVSVEMTIARRDTRLVQGND